MSGKRSASSSISFLSMFSSLVRVPKLSHLSMSVFILLLMSMLSTCCARTWTVCSFVASFDLRSVISASLSISSASKISVLFSKTSYLASIICNALATPASIIFCIAANDTSSRRQLCELLSVGDASLLLGRALLLLRSFTASALTISGTDDCRVRPPLGVGVAGGGGSASLKMDSMSEAHVSDVCSMTPMSQSAAPLSSRSSRTPNRTQRPADRSAHAPGPARHVRQGAPARRPTPAPPRRAQVALPAPTGTPEKHKSHAAVTFNRHSWSADRHCSTDRHWYCTPTGRPPGTAPLARSPHSRGMTRERAARPLTPAPDRPLRVPLSQCHL